jgi:3-hydroxyisobutyrate dehydrogenase
MSRIAFLGLGVMGFPMAGHLKRAGHDVVVYNRTAVVAAKWTGEFRGASAPTPRAAALDRELVFSCVGDDDDLRSVTQGEDGAFSGMGSGAILVDRTTASATVARELAAEARSRELGFVDAPVSGGQAGALSGQLTVICGGDERDYRAAEQAISAYARSCRLMGPSGAGQLTKMVNQTRPGPVRRPQIRRVGRARRDGRGRRHFKGRRSVLANGPSALFANGVCYLAR